MSKCRDQEECPDCPECESQSEDLRTVHFALDMLEYRQPRSPFWAAAELVDLVRRSGEPSPPISAYLDSLLAESQGTSPLVAVSPDDEVPASDDGESPPSSSETASDGAASERNKVWETWSRSISTKAREYYQYVPGGGGGGGDGGGRRCGVERFLFPRCWRPQRFSRGTAVCFEVELVFMDTRSDPGASPAFDCRCCVFRQYLRRVESDATSEYYRIDEEAGVMYGGSRADKSVYTDPDQRDKEMAYIATCKRLEYTDTPRSRNSTTTTWDFVGIVYDRCHSWAIRDAKRMILTAEAGSAGRTSLTVGLPVPPRDPKAAWSHSNPAGEGGTAKGPPGTPGKQPSPSPPEGERDQPWDGPGHKRYPNCCEGNWPDAEEVARQAAQEAQGLH